MNFVREAYCHVHCIVDGQFSQPYTVGIQLRGTLDDNHSEAVFEASMHNRSRVLKCGEVRNYVIYSLKKISCL